MCQVIEDGKSTKTVESYVADIKAFKEFLTTKGVEFNATLQRFYVVSYKNFLVDSNYEVAIILTVSKIKKYQKEFIFIQVGILFLVSMFLI